MCAGANFVLRKLRPNALRSGLVDEFHIVGHTSSEGLTFVTNNLKNSMGAKGYD